MVKIVNLMSYMLYHIRKRILNRSHQSSERGTQVNGKNGWVLRSTGDMGQGDMKAETMLPTIPPVGEG